MHNQTMKASPKLGLALGRLSLIVYLRMAVLPFSLLASRPQLH